MKEVPSLIGDSNSALHDYEVSYVDWRKPKTLASHLVRQSKSVKNALASFARAVPGHGPIKGIRKVVLE